MILTKCPGITPGFPGEMEANIFRYFQHFSLDPTARFDSLCPFGLAVAIRCGIPRQNKSWRANRLSSFQPHPIFLSTAPVGAHLTFC